MSDTPRTDAETGSHCAGLVKAEFARTLERELTESKEISQKYEDRYFSAAADRARLERELAEAKEERSHP